MASTTVTFYGITRRGKEEFEFGGICEDISCRFLTEGISKDIVKVEPLNAIDGLGLSEFVKLIAGCLSKESNFKKELRYAYGINASNVKAIELTIGSVSAIINDTNVDNLKKFLKKWKNQSSKN